eukprot:scaffold2848_cov352-Pavlova_lutheri.AAC.50
MECQEARLALLDSRFHEQGHDASHCRISRDLTKQLSDTTHPPPLVTRQRLCAPKLFYLVH